jgi:hypothetical protein
MSARFCGGTECGARDTRTGELFSCVDLEDRGPAKHPLRAVRRVVNDVLAAFDVDFSRAYADSGRPSIPPPELLLAEGILHDPVGTAS